MVEVGLLAESLAKGKVEYLEEMGRVCNGEKRGESWRS